MKILFLNENPLPETFNRGTISGKELRLRSAIHQVDAVHVICRRGPPVTSHHQEQTTLEDPIVIHRLWPWPYYLSSLPLFLVGLYWTIRLKPQLIEAESPILSGPSAILLGKLFHLPVIVELRASYLHLIKYRFKFIPLAWKRLLLDLVQPWTFSHASAIIANSKTYQHRLSKLGFPSVVINPGLQYAPPTPPVPKFPLSNFTLGFLGRLVPEKGVDLLIRAVYLLDRQPHLPPFQVEIAGSGPQLVTLQTLVNLLDLKHRITFIGMIDNFTVLKHWQILINPNTVNHPLEMVNVEAAHMRVPVVCFGNQLIPETVIDNQTGVKVFPKTPEALSQALATLLTHPNRLRVFQLNGPKLAADYAFTDQVDRLTTLYRSLKLI